MKTRAVYLQVMVIIMLSGLLAVGCKQGGGKPVGHYETLIEIEDTVIKVNGRVVDVDAPIDTWLTYFEGKVDSVGSINGFTNFFHAGELRVLSDLTAQSGPVTPASKKGRFVEMKIFMNNSDVGYQYPDTGQFRKVKIVYNGLDLKDDFKNMEHLNKYLKEQQHQIFRRPTYSSGTWYAAYQLGRSSALYEFHDLQFKISTNITRPDKIWVWSVSVNRIKR
jgi:hypothetical protein